MKQMRAGFQFNIMDAAGYGYYRVWVERAYLLRLALIPVFIKFACTIAIFALDLDENPLRQGLVMLPATFAEGWVLAQFLRTLLMNERWPIMLPQVPNPNIVRQLLNRARGIVASVLVYVLLGMLAYVTRYVMFEFLPSPEEIDSARTAIEQAKATESDAGSIKGALGLLATIPMALAFIGAIWTFRFMCLYIPFAVLMPVKDYMKALSGFMSSVYLIVLFLASMLPATFVAIMLVRVVYGATEDMGETAQMLGHFISVLISVSTEITVGLVTTAAFSWAMRSFLPKAKGALDDFPGEINRSK
ncbi:MAG: hypothetical protein AUJ12_00595 [Alphaproteobacteria bacterium CG1_02_46_17]|nr:MAG: hypothetical protein AUJ12_00595 [Alphaproteobacteria bacterium CG1_02_46_17]